MKTTDIGYYYISISSNLNKRIKFETGTMFGIVNNIIDYFDDSLSYEYYDIVLYVHILDEYAEVGIIKSKDNFQIKTPIKLYLNKKVSFGKIDLILEYECNKDNLETAINEFKNSSLKGCCDIRDIFVKYAQLKGMTSERALCLMVTKIDVPEIDE